MSAQCQTFVEHYLKWLRKGYFFQFKLNRFTLHQKLRQLISKLSSENTPFLCVCFAGLLHGCLRLWITVWCQPSSPQGLVGDEVEVSRGGGCFPRACVCVPEFTFESACLASPSQPCLNTREHERNVAYQSGCWARQPGGGAACTPARTLVLIWFCRQPSSVFPLVELRTPRPSRGRTGWRRGQRGSSRLSPEGESWGGNRRMARGGRGVSLRSPSQIKTNKQRGPLI